MISDGSLLKRPVNLLYPMELAKTNETDKKKIEGMNQDNMLTMRSQKDQDQNALHRKTPKGRLDYSFDYSNLASGVSQNV